MGSMPSVEVRCSAILEAHTCAAAQACICSA
jgi:hypothetical protein